MRQLGLVFKMNKNGFTLIELITTFALSAVIVILLINIVLIIKNIYIKSSVRTELLINQSNLSHVLNTKINNHSVDSYDSCSNSHFCYIFNLIDGESIKLEIKNDSIMFGSYVYKLLDGSTVTDPNIDVEYINNEGILNIRIPINYELYPKEDFGINLIYTFDFTKTPL